MWDEPNQPPAPRYPDDASGYPAEPYPASGHGGEYGGGYRQSGQSGQYGQSPAYQPGPQAPGGPRPQWPGPQYDSPPATAPSPTQRGYSDAGSYSPPPAPAERRYAEPHAEHESRAISGIALPHLPFAHVLLIAGLAAMAYAITQPWGLDLNGAPIFVQNFAPHIQPAPGVDTGALAVRATTVIVGAAAVLSAALILFNLVLTLANRILGIVGLSGCATLLFFPVLWGTAVLLFVVLLGAAGFAGLGSFSSLPLVRDYAFSTVVVKQHSLGFYLWAGGAIAVFVGMLGELLMRRR
ncbi:MAG: hypothetical protein ACXVDA_03975 [Ktedonobacterales bacterium]